MKHKILIINVLLVMSFLASVGCAQKSSTELITLTHVYNTKYIALDNAEKIDFMRYCEDRIFIQRTLDEEIY